MPDGFSYNIQGHNRVANALRRMAVEMPKVTQQVIYSWAQRTRAVLKSEGYPEKNRKKMRWVSDRQRRYVMAAIRRGEIKVPYQRSGNFANRWRATKIHGGAMIANSASYAKYVIGDKAGMNQYWMHKGRWWRARDVINREAVKLPRLLVAALIKGWKR